MHPIKKTKKERNKKKPMERKNKKIIKKGTKKETATIVLVLLVVLMSNTSDMKTALVQNHALAFEIRPALSSWMIISIVAYPLATTGIWVPPNSE